MANWSTTGELFDACPGGAFDMAVGAKKVIVTMEHTDRRNRFKIVKRCSYPLTGLQCVHLIVTDLAVIQIQRDGLVLKEVAPGWTPEEVQSLTEPELLVAPDLQEIHF